MNYLNDAQKKRLFNTVILAIVLLTVFLAVEAVSAVKQYSYIGSGVYPTDTIVVSGTGEAYAIPDTGSFSFSVIEDGKTVKESQDKSSTKINSILSALKNMGIADKDIQTIGYNSGPKYEYQNVVCPTSYSAGTGVGGAVVYCPPGKSVLTGYETSQTIAVKVRKTDQAGDVLTKVGELGATNISNLDFIVDNMDAVNAQARDKAISDAKSKAKALSKSLGIRMVKIVSFSENGQNPPVYFNAMGASAKTMSADSSVAAPQLPVGENKVVSNVSITYEIK